MVNSGYAKLHKEDAQALADVAERFTDKRSAATYTRLLLLLFSTTRDYKTTTSVRQLANMGNATYKQARGFIEKLETWGVLVKDGTVKNASGEYVVRCFSFSEYKQGVALTPHT